MAYFINSHQRDLHREGKESVKWMAIRSHEIARYRKTTGSKPPSITHPQLFDALSLARTDFPIEAECAVHLELLESFHALRVKVLHSKALDETFGIVPHPKTVYRRTYSYKKRRYYKTAVLVKDSSFEERRRAKWGHFLEIAVGRFLEWISAFDELLRSRTMSSPPLPPLDVLMIWHAFLLNPRDFEAFCTKHEYNEVRKVPFPWHDIHQAVNSADWYDKQPRRTVDWICRSVHIEPYLHAHLVMIRKSASPIKTLLNSYGSSGQSVSHVRKEDFGKSITPTERIILDISQSHRYMKHSIQPLKDNVERQMKFVEKMHDHLWISSPAAEGTLCRAVDRYTKFLELFKAYPGTILVPTLDIDLVWHTHQCSAAEYQRSMMERAGRFIDHNDKLGKFTLSGGMDKTVELFTVRFGESYLRCLCWDCEASMSALASIAENASDNDIDAIVRKVEKDLEYFRMAELARRYGGPAPVKP